MTPKEIRDYNIRQKKKNRGYKRCPLCHSDNTKEISESSKVVHALLFSFWSRTAVSNWECKNCGQKW